jgi:hypothetical protein
MVTVIAISRNLDIVHLIEQDVNYASRQIYIFIDIIQGCNTDRNLRTTRMLHKDGLFPANLFYLTYV